MRYSLSAALTDKRSRNSLVPVYEAHSRFSRIRNDLSATSSLHQIRAQALLDKLRRAGEDTKALAAASIDALVDQFTAEVENMELENRNENNMNARNLGAFHERFISRDVQRQATMALATHDAMERDRIAKLSSITTISSFPLCGGWGGRCSCGTDGGGRCCCRRHSGSGHRCCPVGQTREVRRVEKNTKTKAPRKNSMLGKYQPVESMIADRGGRQRTTTKLQIIFSIFFQHILQVSSNKMKCGGTLTAAVHKKRTRATTHLYRCHTDHVCAKHMRLVKIV